MKEMKILNSHLYTLKIILKKEDKEPVYIGNRIYCIQS